jgi:hypothetical protein
MALLWVAALSIFPGPQGRWRLAISAGCGLALALLQPFAIVTVVAVLSVWLVVELLSTRTASARGWVLGSSLSGGAFVAAAAPVLLYDLQAVWSHPALAAWNRQNVTPSPRLWETVIAFFPLLGLSAVALWKREMWGSSSFRFVAVWGIVNLLLLYAPFGLQRRLTLGIFLPLAALAAYGVVYLGRGRRWLPMAALLLTLPSQLVVIGAGLSAALTQDPALVLTRDERSAYGWMAENLPAGSLVLADETSGNRIPAFADLRVVYGHPFETPSAEAELAWVRAVVAWRGSSSALVADLRARGVDYVFVTPDLRSRAPLEWLSSLDIVYRFGDVAVYEVTPP